MLIAVAPLASSVRRWLYICAALVAVMILLGGITRLTDAGLSMTDWHPIYGVLPPLSHSDWMDAFALYQQFPEYQWHNRSITLAQFQWIYLMEYGHRMWGRLIGFVFFLPFLYFLAKGMLTRRDKMLLGATLALGMVQGWVGWWMVQSGLIHEPDVSHWRLAIHFSIALILLAMLLLAARLTAKPPPALIWLCALVFVTMVAGGFVAGLHAGSIYNSFPLMNGAFLPDDAFALSPFWVNLRDNPVLWQWLHRLLATVTFLWAWHCGWQCRHTPRRFLMLLTACLISLQWLLGVATLLLSAPLPLAIVHQMGGVAAFTLSLWALTHETPRA